MKQEFHCSSNGTNKAGLLPSAISPSALVSTSAPIPTATLPGNPNLGLPPGVDEKILERQLVAFIHEHATPDNPMNMPLLGEYCIKNLGLFYPNFKSSKLFNICFIHHICLRYIRKELTVQVTEKLSSTKIYRTSTINK